MTTAQYTHDFSFELIASTCGRGLDSWNDRSLAALLLENQLLRLSVQDLDEFDQIFVELGLKPSLGFDVLMRPSLMQEGYGSLKLADFVDELTRRMRRLDRIHRHLSSGELNPPALQMVLRTVREVSKLTLARYVFTAEEAYQEIIRSLRVTTGVRGIGSTSSPSVVAAETSAIDAPVLEVELIDRLARDRDLYWVSDATTSELNALVEYPLTSAVLVIKPPGSDLEIEIKRAGTRGPRALNVISERNGREAPTSHRVFGGSLGWLAQRESAAGQIFSAIFRRVHGSTAPCSYGVSHSSLVKVPTPDGPVHLLDYLEDESCFGEGFSSMRSAMAECAREFPGDTGVAPASYQGSDGLALQFIAQALPQQAIIVGSSSYRFDRIALYLSHAGPEQYFRQGLNRDYTDHDARWLADTVLEEILGHFELPCGNDFSFAQYVDAAFGLPENRRRADENFLSAMRQIGTCWGTLLAVRGFSDGESFVLRNVGLKSVWMNGDWHIRVIFMDHDDLTVAGSRYPHLWPRREIAGMERDEIHIFGGPMGDSTLPGEVGALTSIYRVNPEVADLGLRALKEAAKAAYRLTQSKLDTDEKLRELFLPVFLAGHRDLDELVPGLLAAGPSGVDTWRASTNGFLTTKGYDTELISEYLDTLCNYRAYFERVQFLFTDKAL